MATASEYERTGARSANLTGRRFDHVFFTSMTLVMLATVFAGFARTYYLAGLIHAPLPSRIIHGFFNKSDEFSQAGGLLITIQRREF